MKYSQIDNLILIKEGVPRGFLSEYTTILTSFKKLLQDKNNKVDDIKISSTMFSLYGHPSNWFDSDRIEDEITSKTYKYQVSTNTIDFDPWPTNKQLNLIKYVKCFPYNKRIEEHLKLNLKNIDNCLGIHFRGTDHDMHVDRVPLEKYFDKIRTIFSDGYNQVFVCSDEDYVIDKFQKFFKDEFNFSNVIFNDVIRSKNLSPLHYSNFDSNTKIKLGDDVLLDSHSLSKCSALICKTSNLINYARILNDNLKVFYVDSNQSFRR